MEVSEHLKIQPTTRSFADQTLILEDLMFKYTTIHHFSISGCILLRSGCFGKENTCRWTRRRESVPAWCLSCVFSPGSCSPFSSASLPSLTESTGPARSGGKSRLGPRGEWQRVAHTQRRGRPTMGLWREEAWPCLLPLMSRGAREEI